MNLNIGSGPRAIPGYKNIDFSPNVILSKFPLAKLILNRLGLLTSEQMSQWDKQVRYRDARKIRLRKESVDLIYSSHFLEHIYYWEAQELLDKCHRALKRNGILRLALPDYKMLAEKFVNDSNRDPLAASWEFSRSLLSHPLQKNEKVAFFLNSRFGHIHKWHPTPAMVEEMLTNSGFAKVEFYNFQNGNYPELRNIENRTEGTMFIEVRK